MRRRLPRTSGPKPVVLPGFITVILTSNDLPRETLEVVKAFVIWGVLHGVVCSKLLQREVGEAIDTVNDPECNQGLHRVWIKLREADI